MQDKLNKLMKANLKEMGLNSEKLLFNEYTVDMSYQLIQDKIKNV